MLRRPHCPFLVTLLVTLAPPVARAAEPPARERDIEHEGSARSHTVAALFDQGTSSSFGASYLRTWDSWQARGGLGYHTWLGLGLDGRLVSRDLSSVDGWLVHAVGRASGLADTGGFSAELAIGIGGGRDTRPIVSVQPAIYFGVYFCELGYGYGFPLPGFDRPSWLSSHQFSVRIHVPVSRSDIRETSRPVQR